MNVYKIIKTSISVFATALLMYLFLLNYQQDVNTKTIGIQLAGEIPEPATTMFLAVGGILLYKRRRRKQ